MHKIPDNFKDFDEVLESILDNFDTQMATLSETDTQFHNSLIDILTKYPESKELIQFIVAINDKLETKNELVKEVLSETLREVIITKQYTIKKISQELDKTTGDFERNITDITEALKRLEENVMKMARSKTKEYLSKAKGFLSQIPPKWIFWALAIMIGFTLYAKNPVMVTDFIKLVSSIHLPK